MKYLQFLILFLLTSLGIADNSLLKQNLSPYLKSHATDAIRWQLFNDKAFSKAREQQTPLLISSGYSACYWCHRMKTDSFSDKETGALVNSNFVPILIDREIEAETDQWLQAFMEKQRGFGGWPLTLILTPEAEPIAAFGYLPGDAFHNTLQRFLTDWEQDKNRIREQAKRHKRDLKSYNEESAAEQTNTSTGEVLRAFLTQLNTAADDDYGGFGDAEKFPHIPQLTTLFELHQLNPDPALFEFLQTSLAALIGGGLRDHLAGGFFRYTDDRQWSQPHYEQMLYTQALIAPLLIRVGQTYKQPIYTKTGGETLLHMIKAFQRKDGLFRASLSAVGENGKAGAYYLWTKEQLDATLGKQWPNKVINLLGDEARLVLPFILAAGEEKQQLHDKLLNTRNNRGILIDQKTLLGWNGLALSALAAGHDLNEGIQLAGAQLAGLMLQTSQMETIPLLPHYPDSPPASMTDQVYLAKGLADWGQISQDEKFPAASRQLLLRIHKRYYRGLDKQRGGWAEGKNNPLLGTRTRQVIPDAQLPSASALWLDTAWRVAQKNSELETLANKLSKQLPQSLETEAFFHATLLSTLIKQRVKIKNEETDRTGGETNNP